MRGEFVDVGGRRLYYYAAGTRGAGEPVLFLHGALATSHLWQGVVPLMPAGHRLVVADLLGCGRSDRSDGEALSAPAQALHVLALMDALGIAEACLVGHGGGGAIATALTLSAPWRVTRLALVNSTAFDAWPSGAARVARLIARTPLAGLVGAPFLAGIAHAALMRGFADPERGRHALDQFLLPYAQRLGVQALVAQLRSLRDLHVLELGARLGAIKQPTSVIWGALDPWIPPAVGEQIRAAIAESTLDVIPGAKHFTPVDAPEAVASHVASLLAR